VEDLSEVQVDPEADGDEIGEQQNEPKPVTEQCYESGSVLGNCVKFTKKNLVPAFQECFST
jgi:hypothetical protein